MWCFSCFSLVGGPRILSYKHKSNSPVVTAPVEPEGTWKRRHCYYYQLYIIIMYHTGLELVQEDIFMPFTLTFES